MTEAEPTLFFLAGPTAVGKTELALRWAETHGAEILSCDALCVYCGMDIGTAKPTAEEQARVPHHGIDLAPVDVNYDIARYEAVAREAVDAITARGNRVLVAGGSGFYLKSFFTRVTDEVQIPRGVADEVAALAREGDAALREALLACNPEGVGDLDLQNPRRVRKALERCRATGKTVPQLRTEMEALPLPFPQFQKRLCVLSRDKVELADRVARRTHQMVEGGLIDEVRGLREAGIERNPAAASAIGYRETLAWLDGNTSADQLEAEINQNTLKLIAKQRKWFRSQVPVERVVDLTGDRFPSLDELFGE